MRWLLTFSAAPPPTEAPPTGVFLDELSTQAKDRALTCPERRSDGWLCIIESSLRGYLNVFAVFFKTRRLQLGGVPVERVEPAFTQAYVYQIRAREPAIMRNFVEAYAPICQSAAAKARALFGNRPDLPDVEDLTEEIWQSLLGKLEQVIEEFDFEQGTQKGWIFIIAYRDAIGSLRKRARITDKKLPTEPASMPAGPEETSLGPEDRILLNEVAQAVEQDCKKSKQRARPDDWDLFRHLFIEGLSNQEIRAMYGLNLSTLHVRTNRLESRIRRVYEDLSQRAFEGKTDAAEPGAERARR